MPVELPAQELKIFLLASMAGLRRNEIDKLEWSAFRWEQSVLRIENSMHFQTKNERSRGVDPVKKRRFAIDLNYYYKGSFSFLVNVGSYTRPAATGPSQKKWPPLQRSLPWVAINSRGTSGASRMSNVSYGFSERFFRNFLAQCLGTTRVFVALAVYPQR